MDRWKKDSELVQKAGGRTGRDGQSVAQRNVRGCVRRSNGTCSQTCMHITGFFLDCLKSGVEFEGCREETLPHARGIRVQFNTTASDLLEDTPDMQLQFEAAEQSGEEENEASRVCLS